LVDPLGFLGRMAEPIAVVIVTMVLTFFTLVVGELAPKRVALQRAERWARVAAPPLDRRSRLARPVVWLLARSTDITVRLLGGDPSARRDEATEEELRDALATTRRFSPHQRRIIAGALDIAARPLRDILVPRRDVVAIDAHTSAGDALEILRVSGHSRAPVSTGDLDEVSGVVHLRDLPNATAPVSELAHPVLALPETIDVLLALRQLQSAHESMAIVTTSSAEPRASLRSRICSKRSSGRSTTRAIAMFVQSNAKATVPCCWWDRFPSTTWRISTSTFPKVTIQPWLGCCWNGSDIFPTLEKVSRWTAGNWKWWRSRDEPFAKYDCGSQSRREASRDR
jgi:CBS domain-containing protein